MPNAISTFPSFVGAAKETTYGTGVPATSFIPATSIASEDVKNYVADNAMRGSAVDSYNQIPTQGWGTFNYDGPVFMDTVGLALKAMLGAEDLSGAGPYTHAMAVRNAGDFQPPSYTLVDYNGYEARSFPGSVCSSLAFTLDAGQLLTYSSQWQCLASAPVTKPTQSFSAKTATAGYKGVVTIAGSPSSLVENATITLARAVNPITVVNGATAPTQQWAGAVTVSGSATLVYTDDTFLTPMLNGTSTTIDINYANGADSLTLHCTNGLFTKAPITRNGNGWMEISVDFTGVANTTDANTAGGGYSPIKSTLVNTVSTVY